MAGTGPVDDLVIALPISEEVSFVQAAIALYHDGWHPYYTFPGWKFSVQESGVTAVETASRFPQIAAIGSPPLIETYGDLRALAAEQTPHALGGRLGNDVLVAVNRANMQCGRAGSIVFDIAHARARKHRELMM